VTRFGIVRENFFRFPLLFAGAVWISMGIFALLPLLLRQSPSPANFPPVSHVRLIPLTRETPPDPIRPKQASDPMPEEPVPREETFESERPAHPEIQPPEPALPEMTPLEMTHALSDFPQLSPTPLNTFALQPSPLGAVPLRVPPARLNVMNVKVNLHGEKAPNPGVLTRTAISRDSMPNRLGFGPSEVDQKPISIATPRPRYPFKAKRMGIEGYVTVHFLVDQDGSPRELTIVKAEPEGFFEKTVRKAVPRWRFKPGRKGGRPVSTRVEMTIRFDLGHNG